MRAALKAMVTRQTLCALSIWVTLAGLWTAAPLAAQMQLRTEVERRFLLNQNPVEYTNYAFTPYEPHPVFGWAVGRYDRLGQYLMQGRVSLAVDEQRPGLSRIDGLPFRQMYEVAAQFSLAVLRDSYLGSNYALLALMANQRGRTEPVTTRFSPLTLNMTRFAGVRFDMHGPKNQGTLIYTRGAGARQRFSFFTMERHERSPVILWGGHWQTTLGSALELGSTFVNQHIIDTQSRKGSVFRGDVPYDMAPPELITVRVVDDSPADPSSPAAAYDVAVVMRGTDADGVERAVTGDPDLATGSIEWIPSLEPTVEGRRTNGCWEARGEDERIEFVFALPQDFTPAEARFVAWVAGDYRIQVRQQHPHTYYDTYLKRDRTKTHVWPSEPRATAYEAASFSTGASLRYPIDFKFPEEEPAYTVVRADGEPRDMTPQEVRFDYGLPTAQSLASVDLAFHYGGLEMDGELALNFQDYKFPVREGERHVRDVAAYYLTAARQFKLRHQVRPRLGAELYCIPADYSGNYDARRGGAIFFTGVPVSPPHTGITQEFDLFDDNDDRDQWPDEFPDDTGLSEVNDAGVYPGLDEDNDNIPDTDRNFNGVPDWDEPFLFFWGDPPEFLYDIDFNNNGLPDMTENDDQPDYPYPRDERGYHAFLQLPYLLPFVEQLGAGLYWSEQLSGGGESKAAYLRMELGLSPAWLDSGAVRVLGDAKRVQDSIPNPTFIWKTSTDPWANQNVIQELEHRTYRLIDVVPPDPDPLLMRNSTVGTLYMAGDLRLGSGFRVGMRHKVLANHQHADSFADGTVQEERTMVRLNLSSRLEYRQPVGDRLDLYARAKHLYWGDRDFPPGAGEHWTTFGPLFEARFAVTEKTALVAGQEGVPYLLPVRHLDFRDAAADSDRWTSVFMLRTFSNYAGWRIATEVGLEIKQIDEAERSMENRTFFVEMFFGW